MLFLCQFTRFPGTSREQNAQRMAVQHDAGANNQDRNSGWYNHLAKLRICLSTATMPIKSLDNTIGFSG